MSISYLTLLTDLQDFLAAVDKFMLKIDSRIGALTILCDFVRQQPPHLYQVLQTGLFENILRCLQTDTSTRVVSLAMTAVIMFLPHIPNDLPPYLPALFNIYSRMLFWDRERRSESMPADQSDAGSNKSSAESEGRTSWTKFAYMLESDDDTVPELLHYFTFLYGLYPINFMSYIRDPQHYASPSKLTPVYDIDIDPGEIHLRSERFRQLHLLHPNMFSMTREFELTDSSRWVRSEASDVVADCMGLYSPLGESNMTHTMRAAVPNITNDILQADPDADIPADALLHQDLPSELGGHMTWRHTGSTMVASTTDGEQGAAMAHTSSQTSHSIPSRAASPSVQPLERTDSPTIPPSIETPASNLALTQSLLNVQVLRGSALQHRNDSDPSLPNSGQVEANLSTDFNMNSLARDRPRSPLLRPHMVNSDPVTKIAYLQREIVLLRNDLNFERYLKVQHLSHISKVRRKQIQEARVEAETQNLINSNRTLKGKLDEARRANLQLRKENERSRANSRKWESNLTAKLKALKEDAKNWLIEKDQRDRELESTKSDYAKLRNLISIAEQRELSASQRVRDMDQRLGEVDSLKAEVDKLTAELALQEQMAEQTATAKEKEEEANRQMEYLRILQRTQDEELKKMRQALEVATTSANAALATPDTKRAREAEATRIMLDGALTTARNRVVEVQKAHNHLFKRYGYLQNAHMELHEKYNELRHRYKQLSNADEDDEGDEPLLAGTGKGLDDLTIRRRNDSITRSVSSRAGDTGSTGQGKDTRRPEPLGSVYNPTTPLGAPGKEDFSVQRERSTVTTAASNIQGEGKNGEKTSIAGLHFHGFGKLSRGTSGDEDTSGSGNGEAPDTDGSRFARGESAKRFQCGD